MSIEGESLGKARLDLEANMSEFRRNMLEGGRLSGGMGDKLDALAAIANMAEKALGDVKMSGVAAAESNRIADRIEGSVGRVGRVAMEASHHLEQVKLSAEQAAESDVNGDIIDRKLDSIKDNANQARHALDRVRITGGIPGRSGVGVGPFGSGFGRIGAFGAAVGLGALTAPGAAPAAIGLLAGIPTVAAGAAGAVGALVLAFQGMGKAIGGDLKAYQALQPEQQKFVQTIRSMIPWIDRLRQMVGSQMFPGLTTGLTAAFSPGTVAAITTALSEFAQAIGKAGEMWGRYFGSAEFQQILGPLMESGAHNLFTLSAAAISLFDAFGVLGRAAVPLVTWLSQLAGEGSAFADGWLRAQDASGGLARAMDEARSSLQLVGGLFKALSKAVISLGVALYPVSREIVGQLTAGLNALSGIIDRNRETIRQLAGGALSGLVGAVKLAVEGIRDFNNGLQIFVGQKAAIITAIIGIGVALALTMGPQSAAITGAVIGIGLIAQHWQKISTFMVATAKAAWTGIKGIFDLGVYAALLELDLIAKGAAKAFGWIPIIGPKIKDAFNAVDGWIEGFRQRGIAELGNAGGQMGAAWGNAFAAQTLSNLKKVSGALDEWASGHRKKALNDLAAQGFTTDLLTGKKIPAAAAPQTTVPGIDFTNVPSGAGEVFGTPPPFDKNVPTAKKPKAPPLLPALASRALDLASANASKASQLGNIGGTAKRYLDNELADLQAAAKLIRDKYNHTVGKVHTELFHALTGVLNKMRTVRSQIKKALQDDRLAQIQFAVDEAELAMASSKEGSAAYNRAKTHEEKLLREEIAFYDKKVKNRKLSLSIRSAALQAEISARQQLNSLIGQTPVSTTGANEAQFLSSSQSIIHSYAPNFAEAFPQPVSTKPLETKGYEQVAELRGIRRILERIDRADSFPAAGYSVASAAAALG